MRKGSLIVHMPSVQAAEYLNLDLDEWTRRVWRATLTMHTGAELQQALCHADLPPSLWLHFFTKHPAAG